MVDEYKELKLELSEKFKKAEKLIKTAEHASAELPFPAVNELRYAGYHYIESDKKLCEGNEKEAIEEMRKALNHARRAVYDVLEFRISSCLEKATAVTDEIKEDEDLAFKYIPNYSVHSKNLYEIGIMEENAEISDKDSPEYQEACLDKIEKLQAFLSDFQAGKKAFFAAKNRARNSARLGWSHVLAVLLGAAIAGIIAIVKN